MALARSDAQAAAAESAPSQRTEAEIRAELKRLAIMMITQQSFGSFDGVAEDPALPGVDFAWAEAEAPSIRFFEQAILHFLETGQIWSGGEPPDITSPEYVSIVAWVKGADGVYTPVD